MTNLTVILIQLIPILIIAIAVNFIFRKTKDKFSWILLISSLLSYFLAEIYRYRLMDISDFERVVTSNELNLSNLFYYFVLGMLVIITIREIIRFIKVKSTIS